MTYSLATYESDDYVFRQGDDGDLMYLVQGGEVEVIQEVAGVERQVAVLERGDFFGEMSILESAPRSHSVRAVTEAKLVKINRAGFQQMLLRKPEVAVRMIRKLARRLVSTEDMLMRAWAGSQPDETMVPPPPRRARLIHLADGSPVPVPDRPEISVGRIDPVNEIFPDIDLTGIDPQLSTSRRHARIVCRADGFFLQEEQATNGTFVNGQRISAARPLEIRSGDEILFGAVRMRLEVDD